MAQWVDTVFQHDTKALIIMSQVRARFRGRVRARVGSRARVRVRSKG